MPADGILSGLKVIDCGTYVAGPAAATILSDFGAEVFKIERPPLGDLFRLFPSLPGQAKSDLNYCWILTGRNRKSIALDLANSDGRGVLNRMVKIADVFVTNYQRTLLEKFHITWDDLCPMNERLVYAHLTGYGDQGDDADAPAFDALAYWARSGLMISVKGLDGSPAGPRPAIGDHPTAMSLFGAIMLGLYHRERTGRGSKVGTSLLASGAWAHACDLQAKICGAEFPERAAGTAPINPLTTGYLSGDGKIVMLVLLDPENEFPRLCRGIGHPELASNPMFATQDARTEHAGELFAILQSQVESRSLAELRKIFAEHDIKWSTIPTMDEVVADPQMRAAGAFIEYDQPGHGAMETINSPIFMAGADKLRPTAAPEVGAQTREVLGELGYSAGEIEQLIRRGAALAAD
jgi:crotonobetainyl-CoA:carnitine CoA-transferase CaiB-like acyl-CoA transferase